ncbi:MAG TPA: Uma2 family endonuclease [Pyrinomonadaceae bacterium]|jgi:Uma2 family endonuclease
MTTRLRDDEAPAKAAARTNAAASDPSDDASVGPIVLRFAPVLKKMSEQEFFDFCQRQGDDVRLELTSEGDLLITSPTGGQTGIRSSKLMVRLGSWAEQDGTGQYFDSSTGFTLPSGAMRSPDFAWVTNERWEALTEKQRGRFAPLCPDFVVELRSRTDSLKALRRKMEEYVSNGARLGWLIDPSGRKVYVYRPQAEAEELSDPQSVSGEPVLRGLSLDLKEIWG